MPNKPLVFYRKIQPGEQPAVSIKELRESGFPGADSAMFRIAFFCRDYILGDDLPGEPVVTSEMKNDITRTHFWHIRNGRETLYSAFLHNPSQKINLERVIQFLSSLTQHKPTQWLLLTMLEQRFLKATATLESRFNNNSLNAVGINCADNSKEFLASARGETGYYVYNSAVGVTVVDVELQYGSLLNCRQGDQVEVGASPDIVRLTYFHLIHGKEDVVTVSAETYTLIYNPSELGLFLMLKQRALLGRRTKFSHEEFPIITEMQACGIPFKAQEQTKSIKIGDQIFSDCCKSHEKNEEEYFLALQRAVLAIKAKSAEPIECLLMKGSSFSEDADLNAIGMKSRAYVIAGDHDESRVIFYVNEGFILRLKIDAEKVAEFCRVLNTGKPLRDNSSRKLSVAELEKIKGIIEHDCSTLYLEDFYDGADLYLFARNILDKTAEFIVEKKEASLEGSKDERITYRNFSTEFKKTDVQAEKLAAIGAYLGARPPSAWFWERKQLALTGAASMQLNFLMCLCKEDGIASVILSDHQAVDLQLLDEAAWNSCRAKLGAKIKKILEFRQPDYLPVLAGYGNPTFLDLMLSF